MKNIYVFLGESIDENYDVRNAFACAFTQGALQNISQKMNLAFAINSSSELTEISKIISFIIQSTFKNVLVMDNDDVYIKTVYLKDKDISIHFQDVKKTLSDICEDGNVLWLEPWLQKENDGEYTKDDLNKLLQISLQASSSTHNKNRI